MNDIIAQASRLASTYPLAYNPGFPLTFNYRPITVSNLALHSMGDATPPGINIYKLAKYTTAGNSYVIRDNMNAKRIFDLFSGVPGNHTDFAGLVMIAFFQNNPTDWYNLFRTELTRMPYSVLLNMITGVNRETSTRFINCSLELFPDLTPNVGTIEQDLTIPTQLNVLRSLLEF